jgi:hypothetical protein
LTLSSVFHSSDAGATLSGNANIPGGTTITFVADTTHAQISAAATGTAAGVVTTITPTGGQVRNTTVGSSTAGNSTLTGGFVAADIGKVIDSACTFGNTKITNVSGGNATIVPGAKSSCTSFAAKIGFTAVSAGNVLATVGASAPFPGARFVYNVLDNTTPSYGQARAIVGYQDGPGGTKSPVCSSAHDVDNGGADSIIADNGFLPVEPHTSSGGNTSVSCYKF